MMPMRKRRSTAVFLVLLGSIGSVLAVGGCSSSREEAARVELIVRAPERGNWSPQTMEVEKGRQVTLVIRNVDVVTHGFYLPAFGLKIGQIKAGEVKELSFTADFEGDFAFYCSVWCSDYHMQMRGRLIVK